MSENEFDPTLLDLHLGLLSEGERAQLLARLADDPALAGEHRVLQQAIGALDSQRSIKAPRDLAARVAKRVHRYGPAPRVVRPVDDLTRAAEEAERPIIRIGNLREIVAAAAMIVLMVGIGVPSLLHMRERNQRLVCTANLATLGQGLQSYARTFNAGLPFAGWNQGRHSWQPTDDPGVATMPNRRHVYRLLVGAYVKDPNVFVCPGSGGTPMPAEQVARHSDFLESENVSYSYYNMAGARPSIQDHPQLPIMSDENPLFEDGVPLLNRLGLRNAAGTNSNAHRSAGQNLLRLDGRVEWVDSPNVGIQADNIWTLEDVDVYTGREGPGRATDAHLIK